MMYVYKFELFHNGSNEPYRTFVRAFDARYKLSDIVNKLMRCYGADEITCTKLHHCHVATP